VLEGGGNGLLEVVGGAGFGGPEQGLDLAPQHFDGVEVRGVGRRKRTVAPAAVIKETFWSFLCGERLSITTMPPARRPELSTSRTQAWKTPVSEAPSMVRHTVRPSRRIKRIIITQGLSLKPLHH
jgi:hypothetical protein